MNAARQWVGLAAGLWLVLGGGASTGHAQDRSDSGTADASVDSGAADGGVDAGATDASTGDASVADAAPSNADAGASVSPTPPANDADEDALPEGHVPEITLRVDDEGVQTGDLVHVVIVANMPEGDDVTLPEQDLGELELHDRSFIDVVENGRRVLTLSLELLALTPGDLELPALRLRVVTADGEVGTVRTEPQVVHVGTRSGNEPDAQPRPPTQPVTVTQEDYTLAWVLGIFGALLLTALMAFLFGRWWRRRPKKAAPPPPPRPPWELALEALQALRREKEALLAEGRQMEFVDRVSDVVRNYLGLRYDFNGLESTSDEVIGRLRKVKLRRIALEDVRSLLADSDLVKFARAEPDEVQCDRMLEGAFAIVRGTTPMPGELPARPMPQDRAPAKSPPTKKKSKKKRAAGDAVVTKRGVTLPLSVRTVEEAQHEIGARVGTAAREHLGRPGFGGTVLVVLGPELTPSAEVDDALHRVYQQLAKELENVPLASGDTAELVIEHYHRRLADAAAAGEAARVSVIDARGVRHAKRRPAGSKRTASGPTAEPPRAPHDSPPEGSASATSDSAASDRAASDSAVPDTALSGAADTGTPAAGRSDSIDATPDFDAPTLATAELGAAAGPREAAPDEPADPVATDPIASDLPTEDLREIEDARRELRRRHEAKAVVSASAGRTAAAPEPARYRLIETAFPEGAERVRPVFATKESAPGEPILRWVTGIEHPVGYELDDGLLAPPALRGLKLSRGQLHQRALDNLRGLVPDGFAPGHHPAYLDGGTVALLLLPEWVPAGESWIAYPTADGTLQVMREASPTTAEELERLLAERTDDDPLARPVRVRSRGFEPIAWPGDSAPSSVERVLPARGAKTVAGHDFKKDIEAATDPDPAADPAAGAGPENAEDDA